MLLKGGALAWAQLAALSGLLTMATVSSAGDAQQIIRDRCLSCHSETGDRQAPFSRISQQRKTPEGWEMTLQRMQAIRGLKISPQEKRTLIKYLSDTQGLAPAETEGVRYVLEQNRNAVESLENQAIAGKCSVCHSGARVALQRRSEPEWEKLVHFHMAQFPTIELLAGARDHDWFEQTINEIVPELANSYPLNSTQWSDWKTVKKQPLTGSWRAVGWLPEKGEYEARFTVTALDSDYYNLDIRGKYADGSPLSGTGRALVYTGYEWRSNVTINGIKMRQVFAASEDGLAMEGRMFLRSANELGGAVRAVRESPDRSHILSISPSYLKQGERSVINIIGSRLYGKIALGHDLKVLKILSRSADRVSVLAEATEGASLGKHPVSIGSANGGYLAVYDRLARVEVTPTESIARVGGNGGKLAKQKVAYRAVGYAAGNDGQPGTEDDLRLGYMPAHWSLKAFDEVAEHDKDLLFAGTINSVTGVFIPGDAGPNPARKMSTNNVGQLAVVATVKDGNQQVSGDNHLLVTVPTFMFPVIQ
ncbi:quinohemoprotein amine dehydrogenase subunit alpha [Motiliproteus sp. MSK22-1]|nr:quinohemoprotein amine dehydrogenase subunit alpha [Motiliproteus sp. MSK22-1]